MKTTPPFGGTELKPVRPAPRRPPVRAAWLVRGVVVLSVALAIGIIWISNLWLTDRFTESTRTRGEIRLALYSNAITSELQRNRVVPLLLSRDPVMISALNSNDFSATSRRLISFSEEIGAVGLRLLDHGGVVVASSNRNELGAAFRNSPFFVDALRTNETVFNATQLESGAFKFTYARRIESEKQGLGVIVVDVDLRQFETRWRSPSEAVLIADSEGQIVIATDPRWRGSNISEALENRVPDSALNRAFEATGGLFDIAQPDVYFRGEAVMEMVGRIPFRGWRITSFSTYASVRERVNGVLAIEIMAFAILLALAFYVLSRRARSQAGFFRRESEELRALNLRLSREIAERQKVQKNLAVAEQSLAQSQKLAALGEMSAAVSHELNQPLAAMKTYLAGAKLLLQRRRPDEAQASFQRIDDLIDRMGAITKQLKSYARKGSDDLEPVDLRDAVRGSLSMMEPQLKRGDVRVISTLPDEPVMVLGDRVRLEQVIINLFRNALDATKGVAMPQVEILLNSGETAVLSVRDNGEGLESLNELFEPFYTTKQPGDGVGLGLAISSGIVTDLGGRLTARNGQAGGAVFEVQLPILGQEAIKTHPPTDLPKPKVKIEAAE
ncbi:sensor histidine kinase [Litoreibacter albidus]|uniref:C4-dicarboxylate transport sensor protein DctB n=1 Tax=Litoreibacter albidus TaxID=670155 RepID=A0A1H2XJE1_9RHOB|nr:ATP-binding protein [Litoreibacter albidus]SDW92975.1 two-component system, NtrC family, C4-dicarboxylate transport sensor histidine kinase DctB [Litoreibacter albidus]